MTRLLTLAASMLVAANAAPSLAQCDPTLTGILGGRPHDLVAADGLTTIVTRGGTLCVVDTLPRGNPAVLDTIPTPGLAYALDVDDDLAGVVGSAGLTLIDLSDPTDLSVHTVYLPDGIDGFNPLTGVAIAGDVAYVAAQEGYVLILDASDPASPAPLAMVELDDEAGRMVYDDYTLFVAVNGTHIAVVDVFEPDDPLYLFDANSFVHGIQALSIDDGLLCATTPDEVAVIDFSDPTHPHEVGEINADAADAIASGGLVYISLTDGGMEVHDVSGEHPVLVGSYPSLENAGPIGIEGTIVSLGISFAGLDVIDAGNPSLPQLHSGFRTPAYATAIAMLGDHALLADLDLAIVDAADPSHPRPLSVLDTPSHQEPTDVAAADGLAYLTQDDQLLVIDVSNASAPVVLGSATVGEAFAVALSGDVAFVGAFGGLRAVDVSDPASPAIVGSFITPNTEVRDVRVVGDLAYLAVLDEGLRIVDVSDPSSMLALGAFPVADATVVDVDADAGIAYLVRSEFAEHHLFALDVGDPADPFLLGLHAGDWAVGGLTHVGSVLFEANLFDGLVVLDASDPAAIQVLAIAAPPHEAREVQVVGTTAHVAAEGAGYVSVDVSSCLGCPADVNGDGVLNVLDFVAFQLLWSDQDPRADCDANGQFNVLDFVCYSLLFAAGCD